MLNDVMGYKSPLYGRSTGSMEVLPFDYLESAAFFPDYSEEEKLIAYGILGGVPRYLNAFDPKRALRENLISEILTEGAFLMMSRRHCCAWNLENRLFIIPFWKRWQTAVTE